MKKVYQLSTILILAFQLVSFFTIAQASSPVQLQGQNSSRVADYDIQLIHDYTARGYFINSELSKQLEPHTLEGLQGLMYPLHLPDGTAEQHARNLYQYSGQLNRALDKIPSYRNGSKNLVYRGIYSESEERPEQRYPLGKIWLERRFTSTTKDREIAKSFAMGAFKNEGCGACDAGVKNPKIENVTLIQIESINGKEIQAYAAIAKEKEVLFKSGTIFKVTQAGRDARGRFAVTLKELSLSTMTDQEKLILENSERQRTQRLLEDGELTDPAQLELNIQGWNRLNQLWIQQNVLDEKIDFEALNEGG